MPAGAVSIFVYKISLLCGGILIIIRENLPEVSIWQSYPIP